MCCGVCGCEYTMSITSIKKKNCSMTYIVVVVVLVVVVVV